MISAYGWKCWALFTWDLVQVHNVYLELGLSIRQNTENVKQMEKMPPRPHRKTGFPGVTRCRLSRTPVALVQVAQNPCRTKMVKALQVRWWPGWWLTCRSCTRQSSPPAPRPPTGWTWPCCVPALQGSHIQIQRLEYKEDYKLSCTFIVTFDFIFDAENCALQCLGVSFWSVYCKYAIYVRPLVSLMYVGSKF